MNSRLKNPCEALDVPQTFLMFNHIFFVIDIAIYGHI